MRKLSIVALDALDPLHAFTTNLQQEQQLIAKPNWGARRRVKTGWFDEAVTDYHRSKGGKESEDVVIATNSWFHESYESFVNACTSLSYVATTITDQSCIAAEYTIGCIFGNVSRVRVKEIELITTKKVDIHTRNTLGTIRTTLRHFFILTHRINNFHAPTQPTISSSITSEQFHRVDSWRTLLRDIEDQLSSESPSSSSDDNEDESQQDAEAMVQRALDFVIPVSIFAVLGNHIKEMLAGW